MTTSRKNEVRMSKLDRAAELLTFGLLCLLFVGVSGMLLLLELLVLRGILWR